MQLPVINLWLALAFEVHVHHKQASAWFGALPPTAAAFCRFTQQGFLRLATNPSVFQDEAVTLAEAWVLYDRLIGDERVAFLEEPAGLEMVWRRYTQHLTYSHKVWNDAYLAAFAAVADLKMVTLDTAFTKYSDTRVTILR